MAFPFAHAELAPANGAAGEGLRKTIFCQIPPFLTFQLLEACLSAAYQPLKRWPTVPTPHRARMTVQTPHSPRIFSLSQPLPRFDSYLQSLADVLLRYCAALSFDLFLLLPLHQLFFVFINRRLRKTKEDSAIQNTGGTIAHVTFSFPPLALFSCWFPQRLH